KVFRPVLAGITPLSLAAGFRPARCLLLRRAFASKKPDSVVGAVLQFRRPLSCPTTRTEYTRASAKCERKSTCGGPVIHDRAQTFNRAQFARCITWWTEW